MRDAIAALIWMTLAVSVLLTWLGVRYARPAVVTVAAILTVAITIPLAWSIGPLLVALAAAQFTLGASIWRRLHWWTVPVIVGSVLTVWVATLTGGALLFA